MQLEAILRLIDPESPLMLWVLGSLLVYAMATNTLWLAGAQGLRFLGGHSYLVPAAQILYYLGIPYLVLGGWPRRPFQGHLLLEDMGLVTLGGRWPAAWWLQSTSAGLGLGLMALALLLLALANSRRGGSAAPLHFAPQPWWFVLTEVLFLQIHWAFYRAATTVQVADPYWGAFLGLLLVYLEWVTNPFWRRGWRSEPEAATQWLRAALALISATAFLLAQNLWVCLVLHGMIELTVRRVGRGDATAPAAS